ncbi:MAG TPA: M48 family metallopeptidase [Bacteroidales bacterium]|nr:M48 family metallopeptidase [Bacteroidales bacterium]HPF02890.1 M48 family metallopeptidase [Bacteroidales bacterium]HPJ58854.1 M48 family metallopeptidase [Bacteroidales bacterium]HPR11010.1 M48 family metallopeptidase [Bacteroidales bacterium]HRW84463.1 M48 family metallopeptidase [Bacteroidales bacterium]
MAYFGLQSQIRRNNTNSVLILLMFPVVIVALTWLFFFLTNFFQTNYFAIEDRENLPFLTGVNSGFIRTIPWILAAVTVWFLIAWSTHSFMISRATGSKPLERKENKRIYNLVENLCISRGMPMPKVNIIEDDSLNAFASGINNKTYTVSLSRGIIDKLNDQELEAVIAHELTHIRNRDVRLLIISVVFVGIFAFISETLFRSMRFGSLSRGGKKGGTGIAVIVALVLALVGYLVASLFRFALSRKREYMADAGSAELTRNPLALASALRKISGDPAIEAVKRNDVAQMFIENPRNEVKNSSFSFSGLFATHPPIQKRIQILEQF